MFPNPFEQREPECAICGATMRDAQLAKILGGIICANATECTMRMIFILKELNRYESLGTGKADSG